MAEQKNKKLNILDELEKDKQKMIDRRESLREKLQGMSKEYDEEGSPVRAGLAKAAEFFMPEKGSDPYQAAMAGMLGPAGGAASKLDDAARGIIKLLRQRGVKIADTIAESPQARQQFVKEISKSGKSLEAKEAQKLADKFAPTTKRNITDVRVEGKKFSPEVREHAAQKAAGKGGPKDVKVAEEIDYSGLIPKVKPRK